MQHNETKLDRAVDSMVLLNTNETEVTKIIEILMELVALMELVTKFWSAIHQWLTPWLPKISIDVSKNNASPKLWK